MMSSYRASADRPQQAKAIVAVILVHVALAAIILTGLKVGVVRHTVEQLTTLDIREPPPPRPPPAPVPKPHKIDKAPAPPAPKAEPTPVVAPPPKIPAPSPIPAAKVAGTGSSSNSGASDAGNGTGAGGTGNGGGGSYAGYSPPGLIRNLGRRDYRAIAAGRLPSGAAMVSIVIQPSGAVTNCRVVRSSGDPDVDAGLCPLIVQRLLFRPALDNQGRPIPFQMQYVATWSL